MKSSIANELREAEPRPEPTDKRAEKKNYAERLSRALATKVANALRPAFEGITPDEKGRAQEAPARTAKGVKKLDVNYSKPEIGLGLGVSIKTINFRDPRTKRYTKNYTRVDNELRAEAKDYHQRQPYAVLGAVVFLPKDSCDDGGKTAPSSFGAAIKSFRHRAGRTNPRNEEELFEGVFVGIYDPSQGETFGDACYFDVENPPPRNGMPAPEKLMTFDELIARIIELYDSRNNPPFEWASE